VTDPLEDLCRTLITELGDDPDRPGLIDTPARWARWWREFANYDPGTIDTVFSHDTLDQMVAVSGIRVWSLCEHHLLPFWCDIAIGYLPNGHVLGLSKFARVAHEVAHRLQVQERLVHDIATTLQTLTGSEDVAVVGRGEHLCMTMRGIRTPATMTTSVMLGRFRQNDATRAEFFELIRSVSQ
jgi:GTP cyclohydrolase I